jgi:hypothetical protein
MGEIKFFNSSTQKKNSLPMQTTNLFCVFVYFPQQSILKYNNIKWNSFINK